MSLKSFAIRALLLLSVASPLGAQVPQVISYQGRLTASTTNFSGAGQFKFAFVNATGAATYWSNDGSGVGGTEPGRSVVVNVNEGLFSVLLGDTNMPNMLPIPVTVFTNQDVRLRVWVGQGTGAFQLLSPDQRLTLVGYAAMAGNIADGSITSTKLAAGAITAGNIADGSITSSKFAPGSVSNSVIADGAITSAKLAPGSVTTAALADGSVTGSKIPYGAVTWSQVAYGSLYGWNIANGTIDQNNLDFQLGYVNPKNPPYYARGDGATDDTYAIQSALNDVHSAGGGVVFLSTGNYRINSHLSIPSYTSLVGVFRAPTAYSQNFGTTLQAFEGAGSTSGVPFITLSPPNATLEGVTIWYPNQVASGTPTPYPWTITTAGGDNATIQNVLLVNSYLGVDFATATSGRHLIRGLYGQPLLMGIRVDQSYDVGRIMDVHFWPFWTQNPSILAFQMTNAIAFDFMRTDWEVVQDVFTWGYGTGARFHGSPNGNGGMNGQMSNVNFDNVDIGLDLTETQDYAVHISNLNIANAGSGANRIGIRSQTAQTGKKAQLTVNSASFWGGFRQCVSWNNEGFLSLSHARCLAWDNTQPAIDILFGRAMLSENYFTDSIGTAFHVGTSADRVMIINNELVGNTINNQGPRTIMANNHN